MKRLFGITMMVAALFVSPIIANDGATDAEVIESFLKDLSKLESVDDSTRDSISKLVEELREESPTDTITEALIELYPEYADAIDATDSDDLLEAKNAIGKFAESDNKFMAGDARFYLARAMMNHEKFEEAIPLLKSLVGDLKDFTVHSGSAQYFIAVAQAGMLDNQAAVQSFIDFLRNNPDAPERLRVSAWRQAQHIQSIEAGELDDIAQRMDFSRRRLAIEQSDEDTQVEQEKIISMLDKLIKDAEKKEAQSSCKNCKSQSQQQQQQQQQQAQSKPNQSKSNKGGTSSNPNGRFVEKSFDNGAQSPWSQLRDRSRDPANTAAREKLPARYREIVERYFEEANKTSDENR